MENIFMWDLEQIYFPKENIPQYIEQIWTEYEKIQNLQEQQITATLLQQLLDQIFYVKKLCHQVLVYSSLLYYQDITQLENQQRKEMAEKLHNEIEGKLSFIEPLIIRLGMDLCQVFRHNFLSKPIVFKFIPIPLFVMGPQSSFIT